MKSVVYVNCCEKSELRTSNEANAVVKDAGKAGDIKIRHDKMTSKMDCEEKMLSIPKVRQLKVLNFVCIDAGGFYQQQVR